MERRDLYEDDLTEERYPTPAQRDDVARTETLDPDTSDDGDDASTPSRSPKDDEPPVADRRG